MPVVSLSRLSVPGPVPLRALRQYVRLSRRLACRDDCLAWQTYRGIHHTDAVFALSWWQSEVPEFGLPGPQESLAAADSPVQLAIWFEASFGVETAPATLLRYSRGDAGDPEARAARDKDMALRAIAAPGTLRVRLARDDALSVYLCALDFDADDALWEFVASPLRLGWTGDALAAGEEEIWALNLPRLDFTRHQAELDPLEIPSSRTDNRFGPLNVVLEENERSGTAAVRAQGLLDEFGVTRLERVCRSMAANGYRSLILDISELQVGPEVMPELIRLVRDLKQVVDRLELADNAERFRFVTRRAYLEQSLRNMALVATPLSPAATRRQSR